MQTYKIASIIFAVLLLPIIMPCTHDGSMTEAMSRVSRSTTEPVSEVGARVEGLHDTVLTNREVGPFPAGGGPSFGDTTRPTCTIAFDNPDRYNISGATIRIFANFTENGSGIDPATVRINITVAGNLSIENYSMDSLNNTRWYYDWAVPGVDGPVKVSIFAADNASNLLDPYPTFNTSRFIDTTLPSATITYNQSAAYLTQGTLLKIFVNFTDASSGIIPNSAKINISAGGSQLVTDNSLIETNETHWYFDWVIPTGHDGVINVSVYAMDHAGHQLDPEQSTNVSKSIDNTAPSCTIAYNTTATYLNAETTLCIYANFTENGSGIDPASVHINITTTGHGVTGNYSMQSTNNTHWYYNWTVPAGNDGPVTIKVYAKDNVNHLLAQYPTTNLSKIIDNTAPTCTIGYNITRHALKEGDAVKIYANFTDAGAGIDPASILINISTVGLGGLLSTAMQQINITHWYYNWTIPAGNDGPMTVKVYAKDNLGQPLTEYPAINDSKIIDNTPPSCIIDYNRTTTYLKVGQKLKIYTNFTDTSSGIDPATIHINITTASHGVTGNYSMQSTNNTHWYYNWTVPAGNDGPVTINVYAHDNATNPMSPYPTTNTSKHIDNTPPSLTIGFDTPNPYLTDDDSITIYANFTENGSGINPDSVTITIHTTGTPVFDIPMTKTDLTHYTYTWDVPSASDGSTNITIKAADNATNPIAGANFTTAKTIDNTPPSCIIGFNRTATYLNAETKLRVYANFTENGSGIDSATVHIDITTASHGVTGNHSMQSTNNTHWYYNWTVPAGNDGHVNISVYAKDNVNHLLTQYPTTNVSKIIDNNAPTCTIAFNTTQTTLTSGNKLRIYANFTENDSGINPGSIKISITTVGNGDTANTSMVRTNITHWYYNWTVPSGTDDNGVATIHIYATDNATNFLDPWPTNNTAKTIANTGGTGGGTGGGSDGGSNTPPIADAGGPYTGSDGYPVTLDASKSRSNDTGIQIVGYRWDFTSDGVYDTDWLTSPTITHTYPKGNYTVMVQVQDNRSGTDTATAHVTIVKGLVTGSDASRDELDSIFGVTLNQSFYARDTNGDGIMDTFVDPNFLLTGVHQTSVSGHTVFLLSLSTEASPKAFWDVATNTITPVVSTTGTTTSTVDTTDQTVTVTVIVEKTQWIYLDIVDSYPVDMYPTYTLTVRTGNRTIPADHVWREGGRIHIFDDAATTYVIIYAYDMLPPEVTPVSDTNLTTAQPTFTITFKEPVEITYATLNYNDIRAQLRTSNGQVFTFTPVTPLTSGQYHLFVTGRDRDNNTRTLTATYTVTVASVPVQFPWMYIGVALVIIGVLIIVLVFLRRNYYI